MEAKGFQMSILLKVRMGKESGIVFSYLTTENFDATSGIKRRTILNRWHYCSYIKVIRTSLDSSFFYPAVLSGCYFHPLIHLFYLLFIFIFLNIAKQFVLSQVKI